MATFNKINAFVEDLAEKKHNLGSDTLTIALTNTAHNASWSQLSNLTQVSYTNLGSRVLTTSSSAQTDGTYKLVVNDIFITATGSVGPFRYIYVYNDTASNDELIGYYDFGSSITMTAGQVLYINFDEANGLIQIT